MPTLIVDIWGSSDQGKIRDNNEDAIFFVTAENDTISAELIEANGQLMAVADGVGGVWGGEEASQYLIEGLVDFFYQKRDKPIPDHLVESIEKANKFAREKITYRDSSTTLVAAVIHQSNLYIAHVGDSRAYLMRNRTLQQLTEDHAYGSRLLRYLVSTDLIEVEIQQKIAIEPNDQILLCSDGFYREITKTNEVIDILVSSSAEEATYQLIDLANSRGGHDNITVLVGQVRAKRSKGSGYQSHWESIY